MQPHPQHIQGANDRPDEARIESGRVEMPSLPSPWPALPYDAWHATCDTLHAHTQVLGKLAAALAPPEPQLQHAALRETLPLPAPDGSGAVVAALDLRSHHAVVEHTDCRIRRAPLGPDRPVAHVTRDVLDAVSELAGPVRINPTPQETPWTPPLDEDYDHATSNSAHVDDYFAAATHAAPVLSALRAPYRGRSSPVNAWWGTFDLAVSLYSGETVAPPSNDFIMRNSATAQQIEVGWWPGDTELGEYLLDWDDARRTPDPHRAALEFGLSAIRHACIMCSWDPTLAASAEGIPHPIT